MCRTSGSYERSFFVCIFNSSSGKLNEGLPEKAVERPFNQLKSYRMWLESRQPVPIELWLGTMEVELRKIFEKKTKQNIAPITTHAHSFDWPMQLPLGHHTSLQNFV